MPVGAVLHFDAPAGNQPTTIQYLANSDQFDVRCRLWFIRAKFQTGPGLDCRCCEYRQHVRSAGIFLEPPEGPLQSHPLVTHWERIGELWTKASTITPDIWAEDTQPDPLFYGLTRRYGYRTDYRWRPQGIAPDRYPTRCSYIGFDEPHFSPLGRDAPDGTRVRIDVEFKGSIVDTCRGNLLLTERIWTWRFDGLLDR